jgi:phospholipase/lecithinase/hemolysin
VGFFTQKRRKMKIFLRSLLVLVVAGMLGTTIFVPSPVLAYSFSNIVAFGDSLSDNGPADGYGIARFSNGPVWVEYLANSSHLNAPLLDLAYGGSTTGTLNPFAIDYLPKAFWNTGLNWQVDTYLTAHNQVSSSALVTISSGADDFNVNSYTDAVTNIGTAIQKLETAGARNFLILNLPNIGATPQVALLHPSTAAAETAWDQAFNSSLGIELADLKKIDPTNQFFTLDLYSLHEKAMANPQDYGFSNISDFYWIDGLHPSTKAHELIADMAFDELQTVVPIPSTMLLLGSGLIVLAGLRRKSKI